MKSIYFLVFTILVLTLAVPSGTFGQTSAKGQLSVPNPLVTAITLYQETLGYESHLYNGPEYVNYSRDYMVGHQFFRSDEEAEGSVFYDGTLYTQVPMVYDILMDKIVLEHPVSALTFMLVNEKVSYFTLHGHTFIRLVKDTISNQTLKTGFYDLLYRGPVHLLAKRVKTKQEKISDGGLTGNYELNTKYYIYQAKKYYLVKNLNSALKALPGLKKELQKYAREQKLNFRKNRENALLQLTLQYAALKGPSVTPQDVR